ncbi:hypothetical protein V6N11_083879 [Hibiscus sabdariffa]|uniref:Uncharacterized protein n=1 Tax=Hibiscus sabdariffa TaxID=183260 RepID=A0ABR2QDC8_9ROSI
MKNQITFLDLLPLCVSKSHLSFLNSQSLLKIWWCVVSVVWRTPSERHRRFSRVGGLKRGYRWQRGAVRLKLVLADLWCGKGHGCFRGFYQFQERGLFAFRPLVSSLSITSTGNGKISPEVGAYWFYTVWVCYLFSFDALIFEAMVVQERSTMLSMFVTSTVHFEEVRSPSLEICGYLVVDHASNQGSYRGFPLFMNKVAGSYGMYFEYRLYNERNKVFSCTWAGVKLKITDHIVQCRRGYGRRRCWFGCRRDQGMIYPWS